MTDMCNETYDKFCSTGYHTTDFGLKRDIKLTLTS